MHMICSKSSHQAPMMADGNELKTQTSHSHQIAWLNNEDTDCREVRATTVSCLCLDTKNNHLRNRLKKRARCKRIAQHTESPTRQIRSSRRKFIQASTFYHVIALFLLELFFLVPIISSFTVPPSPISPIYKTVTSTKSTFKIYSSSFPQHDEYIDDNDDDVPYDNNPNPQLYRQNYNQLGSTTSASNDRRRMIMNSMNQSGDDDEWEDYLNLDIDGDGEVIMGNHVTAEQSDLPVKRKEEEDVIDRTPFEQPIGGERSKSRDSVGRSDIIDFNANPRNGIESPQRSDIKAAQPVGGKGTINGECNSIGRSEEVISGSQEVPPPNNAIPMSATRSSQDATDFRQQFISRSNNNVKGANSDGPNQQAATSPPPSSSSSTTATTKRKRVTTEEIEFIKSTIPLTDVIETYNLDGFTRTNTHSAKACCPFHDDNNPSMSIDDNRGLYKCFACGAGGDVFNFIREYDYIENKRSGEDKMGYMQAVEYAAREFGDDRLVSGWNFGKGSDASMYEGMSEEAKEKMIERQRKKERIRQANTAAAAFYTKCLVTLSTAGKARAHLRSRNISPESVREFALGYAPDCYYGDEASDSNIWGEGSLINYLAEMEFTPDEIVEAGLATRTKTKKFQMNEQQSNNTDAVHDYSSLMDRFRSRLIVPILDDSGQHVIAFGGRHLESVETSDDTKAEKFTPAKYINSPESLIFTKKNVLFNRYKANQALNVKTSDSSSTPSLTVDAPKSVVIVEGYFDAIALSNVGIKNVVASMGTALPPEQLQMAAEMGKVPGGRIVLCMDGDEAGQNAVARLSGSSSALLKTLEVNLNEIFVATLPDKIKDPSDFVDYAGGGNEAKVRFEEDVLDKAVSWNDWNILRILSQYDETAEDGAKGSFSGTCDEVSTFLATFTNPADRTRRVYNIAEKLVDLIAPSSEKNSTSSSMMRVQLESDILNMATRKAGVREAMERRIEQADGFSGDKASATMEKLARGGSEEDNKLMSANALARMKPPPKRASIPKPLKPIAPSPRFGLRSRSASSKTKRRRVDPPERHFVPHFNGFTFEHKSDRDWLGISDNRNNQMHLGSDSSPFLKANQSSSAKRKKQDVVYFNSNRYFGQQFITPEAIQAGYTFDDDAPSSDETIADFMDRKILTRDENLMIEQAETRLLHALVKFPQARAAMMTVYSASTFGPKNMRWTSEERAWLFLCLTGSPDVDPVPFELLDGGTSSQLLSSLSQRPDCPVNAFSRKTNSSPTSDDSSDFFGSEYIAGAMDETPLSETASPENELDSILGQAETELAESAAMEESQLGILDVFFLDDNDLFPSFSSSKIAQETRAELTVQETVAALLRATAMKRFSTAKSTLKDIVYEMDRRENEDYVESDADAPDDGFGAISSDDLQEMFIKVGSEVVSAQKSLYEAERSCDRVNSHLLDHSVSSGVQYKLSQASVERLNKMMDEHIASLPEDTHRPDSPGHDNSYVFGSDEFDENIDAQYGGVRPDVFDPRLPN